MLHSQVAYAGDVLPTNSNVVSGAATVGVNGSSMTVNQSTNRAVINWNSFSIGAQNKVEFVQPSKDASVLNRVTGDTTSSIAGQLTGNGQVYIVNPNGIFITPTGAVKTGGGFIASTNDIADSDFNAGRLKFNGTSSGRVQNSGSIEVGEGGFAALLSNGGVVNDATISVPAGKVALGSGASMTLDPTGVGFLQILAPSTQADNAVTGGGKITADGGRIELKASAADKAVRSIVNVPGDISASSARASGGAIVLDGGAHSVSVTGKLSAASSLAKGGAVKIAGRNIQLNGAKIDVSGASGGGAVGIGGGRQGTADAEIPTSADVVHVDENSVINADATVSGKGGSVILWSTLGTRFAGQITARGGAQGGDGGFVETSSLGVLSVPGKVDAAAKAGKAGEWLLDPSDVTISLNPDSNFTNAGGVWTPNGTGTSVINAGNLATALINGTSVTIITSSSGTQNGDIFIENATDILAGTSSATLTLWATRNITLLGSIYLSQSGTVTLRTDTGYVTNNTGANANNAAKIQAGALNLNVAGSVLLDAGGDAIGTISGTFGSLKLQNHSAISLSSLTATSGGIIIHAYGAADNLTIKAGSTIFAQDDVVLSTGGKFINNAGPSPITTPGRWLIYSNNPATNTFGGLDSNNSAFWNTGYNFSAPASVASGNRYLFAYQPKVTITTANVSKTYGADATSNVSTAFSTSAEYATGVASAFLPNSSFYTGAPSITSAGSAATANVVMGGYSIDAAQGTLAGQNGYGFAYASNGVLTVNTRAITITADDKTRVYGNANPTLTYTIGGAGLANGDTLTGALTTAATTSSGVGTYAILQGALAASSNYVATFTGGTLTVTARAITVTADAKTRAYGDANPTLTYTVGGAGLASGDTLTGGLVTLATTTSGVGNYAINQGTLAASSNYAMTFTGGVLAVTARAITVTANALSRAYGDANPTLTYVVGGSGLVNGDTLTGALSTTATTTSGVGAYAIAKNTLAASTNYALTYVAANLTVTPRAITVTADAKSRQYGDVNPTLTYVLGGSGLVNGDTLSGVLATTATQTSNVGSYAITQNTLAATSNYALTYAGANLTVTKRAITVAADAKTRQYGDANPALTYQLTGGTIAAGDTLAGVVTGALITAATTTSNVGAYAITQNTLAASANYALTFTGANLTVTARAITVTADAKARAYNTANPALTYQVTSGSLVGTDAFTGALATTATTASAVGSYAITQGTLAVSTNYAMTYVGSNLTVGGAALVIQANSQSRVYGNANPTLTYTITSGALAAGDTLTGTLTTTASTTSSVGTYAITQGSLAAPSNYAVTFVNGTLTVTARAITVTADAKTRQYGDANPALTYVVGGSGLVNGDTLSGALATTAAATSGVGSYTITQGGVTASSNYAVTYAGANLTVTQRAITVTADAKSRVYGDANPALTYVVSGAGLVNGDTLSGALSTAATATSGVGTYAIAKNTLAASANYALTYVGANLAVTQRALTVTADAKSRAYGDANPALTYVVGGAGLVNGDTLSGALSTAATTTSNVGAYGIAQGTVAASGNYALTYTGANLTVTQRALTVTADAKSRAYGDLNPALTYAIAAGNLVNGDTLTGALSTTASVTSGVGTYAIAKNTLAASGNYALTYTGANLTVTQRALTVTADAKSRTYGDANPTLTYVVGGAGLVNGDTLTGALATAATTTSHAGVYAIDQGTVAASANYALTYTGANLTVAQRALTVTADAKSRVYGDANPALTYAVGGAGLVNGDALSGALSTAATATSNVGTYGVAQGSLTAGADYALTYTGANLTVSQRALTVTADAKSRAYGDANPALTYVVGGAGLVNGDTLSGGLSTAATTTSNVGVYGIAQGSLAASSNYALAYTGANLSVTKRAITVKADDQKALFGAATPTFTTKVVAGSVVNGDVSTGSPTVPTGTTQPGTFDILQGTFTYGGNYAMTFQPGSFTVIAPTLAGVLVRDPPLLAPGHSAVTAMLDRTPTGSVPGASTEALSDAAAPTSGVTAKSQCYTSVARAVIVYSSTTVLDLVPCR